MRPERQIKERIEILEAQNEDYMKQISMVDTYTEREYYRQLVRKNLDSIELLLWVVDESVASAQQKRAGGHAPRV